MTSSDDTQFDPAVEARLRERVGSQLVASLEGRGVRVGIACGRFNGAITTRLLEGALDALGEHGVDRNDIVVAWAPGAFELPLVARGFALGEQVDAVITLGAVIRGDTGHQHGRAGARALAAGPEQQGPRVRRDGPRDGEPTASASLRLVIEGVVVDFDEARGDGLLRDGRGGEYYFHCVQIADQSRRIDVGAVVRFRRVVGLRGRDEAADVEKL